jgi:hypothetical protein
MDEKENKVASADASLHSTTSKVAEVKEFIKSKNLEETQVTPLKLKRASYIILGIILLIVLGFGAYFIVSIATFTNKKANLGPVKDIAIDTFDNAFLTPRKPEEAKFYNGKIEYAYEVVDDPLIKHKLIDKDGNTIFYLFSSQNDLNLSVGLDVEIDGKLNKNKYNDISILEVSSIKLK